MSLISQSPNLSVEKDFSIIKITGDRLQIEKITVAVFVFYGPVNSVKVMSSQSVDLLTISRAGLVLLLVNQYLFSYFCQ